MKKFCLVLLFMFSAMSVAISNAEAKRLGGGGSFGRQSQSVSRQAPTQSFNQAARPATPAAPTAAPGAIPPKPASPWRGMLGGALVGLGLGALMSHFGMGGAMGGMFGNLLMLGLLAFGAMFLFRMLKGKSDQPAYTGSYPGGHSDNGIPEIGSRIEPAQPVAFQSLPPVTAATNVPWGIPANFDMPGFLRSAKANFIRLQAAWDKADIDDIREFTSPEMFAELRLQIQERGASPNTTDVVAIDAELLGIETVGNDYLASVKFNGMIKEAANASAEPFAEVWNLAKPVSGPGGWILAGIQQLA